MRILSSMLIFAFLLVSVFSAQVHAGSEIVATVNGVALIKAELDQEMSKLMPMESRFHGRVTEEKLKAVEAKAMNILVEMELQYQYALSKGLKLDKKTLENEMGSLAASYPDRETFLDAVKKAGFTEKSMERFVSRNVLAKQVKAREVDDKLSVSDAQVSAYFNDNKSKYMKPEEFRASIILVKVPPSATQTEKAKYRAKIEKLSQQLKEGADFGMLAASDSDDMTRIKGGDLGMFHAGQSDDPEFDVQIAKMKVGDVSGILTTLQGFCIVKLTDKRSARQIPFEEAKDKIKNQLISQQRDTLFTTWMDGLRKKAVIVYPSADSTVKGHSS